MPGKLFSHGYLPDTFILLDHGDCGDFRDMPEDIIAELVDIVGKEYYGLVWITAEEGEDDE